MNASARLFVAVRLGDEVNAAIAPVAEGLREKARRFGMRCSCLLYTSPSPRDS